MRRLEKASSTGTRTAANWNAYIGESYSHMRHLGSFCTKDHAIAACNAAASKHDLTCTTLAKLRCKIETFSQPPVNVLRPVNVETKAVTLWKAVLRRAGIAQQLGVFCTKEEAAEAYDTAARKYSCDINFMSAEASATVAQAAVHVANQKKRMVHRKRKAKKPAIKTRSTCSNNKNNTILPCSGYYGVTATGDLWQAEVTYRGKSHILGKFSTKEEAAKVRDTKVRQIQSLPKSDKFAKAEARTFELNFGSEAAGEVYAAAAVEQWNQQQESSSTAPSLGLRGATFVGSNKWMAAIVSGAKRRKLGMFRTEEEAGAAFDTEVRKIIKSNLA